PFDRLAEPAEDLVDVERLLGLLNRSRRGNHRRGAPWHSSLPCMAASGQPAIDPPRAGPAPRPMSFLTRKTRVGRSEKPRPPAGFRFTNGSPRYTFVEYLLGGSLSRRAIGP